MIRCYNDQIIFKRYIWEVIGYFIIKCGIMICEKGTIGLTMSQSDMPFSEEGISPDLIVNPQAIPSEIRSCGLVINCKSLRIIIDVNYLDKVLFLEGNTFKLRESRQ